MGELDGIKAAVWGDASGVGAAIAAAFEDAGAELVRGAEEEVDAFLGAAAGVLGGLDLAVICVDGPGPSRPLAETSDEEWAGELEAHLGVAFRGVRRALVEMLPAERGQVIVTTSVESKVARPGATPFVAAQHGVAGLVKSAAHEVGRAGVTVNALVCGVVGDGPAAHDPADAALLERSAIKRPNTPEEVAAAALTLASPTMTSVTGALFPVHGGSIPY
jgi:NAD(P)-dependent dehydrogenase (short-subunit alcohol dehydrogenase family)